MKLYVYDHCPYCVRAKMIFGLRDVEFEEIVLSYDDEKTPTDLVGKKMLPILVDEDGKAMPESLDIVAFIDAKFGVSGLQENIRPEVQAWLEKVGQYANKLTSPREIRIGLPEFASPSAIEYFVNKKTPFYGDFDENFAKTDDYLAKIHQDLQELESLIKHSDCLGDAGSYEDIVVFPVLRNLTMVKAIVFPPKVRAYIDTMAKMSQVKLYDDVAI